MKNNKKTIFGVVIIILIVLGILFLFSKNQDKPFNQKSFKGNNLVFNKTKINYLDTLIFAGLQELSIENTSILILPLNKNIEGDIELQAHIRQTDGGFIIWIAELNRIQNIEVISHELIHLQQYNNKDLILTEENKTLIYKDTKYEVGNLPSYDSRPWETEAFAKQEDLKTKIKNILY